MHGGVSKNRICRCYHQHQKSIAILSFMGDIKVLMIVKKCINERFELGASHSRRKHQDGVGQIAFARGCSAFDFCRGNG